MKEHEVVNTIRRWQFIEATKRELEEQLESIVYKTTATYGDTAGGGGGFTSKVEDIAIKRQKLIRKIRVIELEQKLIIKMIQCSGLTDIEKSVLWEVAKCGNLRRFAQVNKICKSNVYKIRDRAIKKVAAKW